MIGIQSHENIDIVMTSPPYSNILPILKNAFILAKYYITMKLPIYFLFPGPTNNEQRDFLIKSPPTSIIPIPRAFLHEHYKLNMDEAWFVWSVNSLNNVLSLHRHNNRLFSNLHTRYR